MDDARSVIARRTVAGALVSLVGFAVLAAPLYDMWDDVADLNWSLLLTIVENSLLLAMSLLLVAGGVWLARSDWDPRHVTTVARWTATGLLVSTVLFAWVITTQRWAMHRLKPFVIALDGIVLGATGTFAAGVYKARMDARTEALVTERERFAGLFQNTSDAIAAVEVTDTGLQTTEVNQAFEYAFGDSPDELLDDVVAQLPDVDTQQMLAERVEETGHVEAELTRAVGDDQRNFLTRLVPFESGGGRTYIYLLVTDITDQTRLVRERAANERMRTLHEVARNLAAVDSYDELHELTMDAVDRTLDADRARLFLDGELVAERTFGEGGDPPGETQTLTGEVADRGRLEVVGDGFEVYERTSLDLLTTHLDRTLARLDREEALRSERDQLEFINRTLRHNLLNDLQVARAHLDMLDPSDERTAQHQSTVVEHVEDMAGFVDTMRSYMSQLVDRDEHDLEPRSLRDVVVDVTTKAENAHDGATVDVDLPDVMVTADDLLGPLFENLVTNALEHHDRDEQHVRISGERDEDTVTVRVADDGPGISDDLREAVFERGELGVQSTGSGFGLYLVDQAVDTYGGSVEITDNEPRGTVFHVTLPLAEDDAAD